MNKMDKGLELLAEVIAEDMEKEIAEIEQLDVEVPEALHQYMMEFVQELDRKDTVHRKKQCRSHIMQFAAVFCVCIVTMGTLALGTSEALRERAFSLFHNDKDGSVTLRTENEFDMIGGWDDYWYPTWIPEGYYMLGADKKAGVMLFVSDTEEAEIRIIESSLNRNQSYDKETSNLEKIEIQGFEGYMLIDDQNKTLDLVWITDNKALEIKVAESVDKDMILKIAQNMKYIPQK